MKTIRLTDEQHRLLLALINSDVLGTDMAQDMLMEAAAEILGQADANSDDSIDAQIELQGGLWDAIGAATTEE